MTRKKTHQLPHANVSDFLSVLGAIHLSSYVASPFKDRGGLMIVGPPGVLKTTCVDFLDKSFGDVLILSDMNVQSLTKIKERVAGGGIRSLVMSEMGKIYERHSSVSMNVEGTLRAFAGEGFSSASFEDATISRLKARATVIGAMTGSLREKHASRWDETGFARRFLWSLVSLRDPLQLDRAVIDGQLIDITVSEVPRLPVGGIIPDYATREEKQTLLSWCKYQPAPHTIQISLLVKTWCVLKWWARHQRRSEQVAWKQLERFALSLGRNGVELVVE